ncbi:helix-turn-helix domain-containing protein [Nocardia sp. NPDC004860]|uniref:PucR family transcriptional regulator n=1 Tax=Nocardia sp. NPDC004860 TaxID=3154557 RepID=UPI0033A18F5F
MGPSHRSTADSSAIGGPGVYGGCSRDPLVKVAGDLLERLSALADETTAALALRFTEFGEVGSTLRHHARASFMANLRNILTMFRSDIDGGSLGPPPEALAIGRLIAPILPSADDLLVRIYHVGENFVWDRVLFPALVAECCTAEELVVCTAFAREQLAAYLARALDEVVGEYKRHRDVNAQDPQSRRATLVSGIVADRPVDRSVLQTIPYDWDGEHVAFICWSDEPVEHRKLQAVADLLNAGSPARRHLAIVTSGREMWGWFQRPRGSTGIDEAALLRAIRSHGLAVHVAIGEVAGGMAGFRRGHSDARRVQEIVSYSGRPAPTVTTYEGVALAALLVTDREAALEYSRRVLGPLAENGPNQRVLRETVHAFLQNGCSYARTAQHLLVHRNTVLYRVQKVERTLGYAVSERMAPLSNALLIAEWLPGDGQGHVMAGSA